MVGVPQIEGYSGLEVIGRGGYGIIYRARQQRPDRDVAIKVITFDFGDERAERRFRRECDATGEFTGHPNVITVLDSGRTREGLPYLTLPFCPEGSLYDRVRATGPFPPEEVEDIALKIARALRDVHAAGIIHRDLKPQNILLTPWGEPALADFGIATVIDAAQRTGTTDSLTPLHSAPEILRGETPTIASDIYSYGSTMATLLCGRAPYSEPDNDTVYAVMNRVLSTEPAALPASTPPHLAAAITACLAKEPDERPTIDAVIATLEGAPATRSATIAGQPTLDEDLPPLVHDDLPTIQRIPAAPDPPSDPAAPPRAGRRWPAAAAALAAVAVLVTVGVVVTSGDDPGEATADETTADEATTLDRDALPAAEAVEITATTTATSFPAVQVGEPFRLIGSTAWSTNWNNVEAVDLATGETTTTPLADGFVSDLVFEPDETTAWVSGSIDDGEDGTVFQVDLESRSVTSTFELGFRPRLMTYAAADRVAIVGTHDVVVVSPDGEIVTEIEVDESLDEVVDLEVTKSAIWMLDWTGEVWRLPLDDTTASPLDDLLAGGSSDTTANDLATIGERAVLATTTVEVDADDGPGPTIPALVVIDPDGDTREIAVPSIGSCALLTEPDGLTAMCGGEPISDDEATIELWRVDAEAASIDLVDRRFIPEGFSDDDPTAGRYPGVPLALYPTDDGSGPATTDIVDLWVKEDEIVGQRLVDAFDMELGRSWLVYQADGVAGFGTRATTFWPWDDGG